MPALPWPAVAVAAVAYFVLGGLWYTAFGTAWLAALGKTRADVNPRDPKPYLMAAFGAFLNAAALAWVIHGVECRTVTEASAVGGLLGVGVVAAAAAKHYAFANWSGRLLAIDLGLDAVGFTLMGVIIGAMK